MTEGKMRRFGLKLLFGTALTVLLVASVRQQWNSSRYKLARQMASADESDSSRHQGEEDQTVMEGRHETGNKAERVDEKMEEHLETIKDVDKSSMIVPAVELKVNTTQGDEVGEAVIDNTQDKDSVGGSIVNVFNGADEEGEESDESTPLSSPGLENSRQTTNDNDEDVPTYEDNDHYGKNWRATKFSDALYDDEESATADYDNKADDLNDEEDTDNNYNNVDSLLTYTNTNDTNVNVKIEQPFSDLKKSDNSNGDNPSLFSWLQLPKYLHFGNKPHIDDQRTNEIYYNGDTTSEDKLEDVEVAQRSNSNVSAGTFTENEGKDTMSSDAKVHSPTQSSNEYSKSSTNEKIGNISQRQENETQNIQKNGNSNQLPFNVNGIDEASYDDLDDEKDVQTQKKEPEDKSRVLQQIKSSLQYTSNRSIPSLEVKHVNTQDGLTVPHLWDKGKQIDQIESSITHGFYDLQSTQQNQQPLRYQKQQVPFMQQLPQEQQMLLKSLLPPRLLDILLSQNLESSYLRQFPAKMQYLIHQNINRIDQDFDPLANNETKYTANMQAQIPPSQTSSINGPTSSAMRSLQNEEVEHREKVHTNDNGRTIVYEDYDNDDNNYENGDNKPDGDATEQDNIYTPNPETGVYDNIYTPNPETGVYDNPRPLSDEQFALFRTRPSNTNAEITNSLHRSDIDAPLSENNGGIGEPGWSSQQISKPWIGNEDETLTCPRDVAFGKMPRPVTALVAFSSDGILWVRKILEQLTGIETDSIYNIMAQLKLGNVASVYQMGRKVAIETHIASEKNFERAIVVLKNPFAVDVHHKTFRPSSVDWQKIVLWNRTYSTWLTSSLPVHVMSYEDLVERPITELIKLTEFLFTPEMTITYKCAMKVALDPPDVIDDFRQIVGIYHDDRRRISQNIDYVIQVARTTHPYIVSRLNSYKAMSGIQSYT